MRRLCTLMSLCVFAILLVSFSFAQQVSTITVPNLIRYAGTLRDANGNPVSSSTVGVTFAIYSRQDGGAAVWMETQNVTTDAGGSYSAVLGSTTATGLPNDLFSHQEQRWLGVQVQGQAEQPRVLMVSVPYAFKAHEAETLAGKSISDFVLANGANSSVNGSSTAQSEPSNGLSAAPPAASDGPTNFSGSTTDQIVAVTQNGTGSGLVASAPTLGIQGTATAPSGTAYGVQGVATGTAGVGLIGTASSTTGSTYGLRGTSSSTSGTGVRGIAVATSGSTVGISGYVASSSGAAGVLNNAAGGNILIGQNNGTTKFTVDGSGNVRTAGTFTGSGSGLTGIAFSNLAGTLTNSQFSGTYASMVNLMNTSNEYYGDGSHLTGIVNSMGSPYYIQNGMTQQSSSNFNISGTGTANNFAAVTGYQITGSGVVLSIGNPANTSLFVGVGAGANNAGPDNTFSGYNAGHTNGTGAYNTFFGYSSGYTNASGIGDTFSGYQAGYSNDCPSYSTFTGYQAGYSNNGCYYQWGDYNTFTGAQAGFSNVIGQFNTFTGFDAGYGSGGGNGGGGLYNTYYGAQAGYSDQGPSGNSFYGYQAGYNNSTGSNNTFLGNSSGLNNVSGNSNIYIGNQGPVPSENNHIRIGTQGNDNGQQNVTYIAGIYGSMIGGSGIPVYVDSTGLIGTVVSSRRFKEQIADMGDSTSALMKLRPVTFHYKSEYTTSDRALQYGLIAEEVAEVYPELVAYDQEGQPYTVRYQYLAPMLLNELQKQYRRAQAEADVIETQEGQLKAQEAKIGDLEQRLSKLESLMAVRTAETRSSNAAAAGETQ